MSGKANLIAALDKMIEDTARAVANAKIENMRLNRIVNAKLDRGKWWRKFLAQSEEPGKKITALEELLKAKAAAISTSGLGAP